MATKQKPTFDPTTLSEPVDFDPYTAETWAPTGFGRVKDFFRPLDRLRERHGEEAIDPARFDWGTWNVAVAKATLDLFRRRLSEAISPAPTISFQKVAGKRRDGVNVTCDMTPPFSEALRRFIGSEWGAFGAFLETHYTSRPGFCPYHSIDPADWMNETEEFTEFRTGHNHKLGMLLRFVVERSEASRGETRDDADIYRKAAEDGPYPEAHYSGSLPDNQ
jgi:hypothetical protein